MEKPVKPKSDNGSFCINLVRIVRICYDSACIKSWEFHANLLFAMKGKVDGLKADVARQSNPNPLNAGIFFVCTQEIPCLRNEVILRVRCGSG